MRRIVLPALLLAASVACPAAPTLDHVRETATDFAAARAADGRELLLGHVAPPPLAPVPAARSCAELYARRVALIRTQLDYRPAYTDDPRNAAAFAVGTIWGPALAFLPFSAMRDYLDADRQVRAEAELDGLRAASASRLCFER